MTCEQKFDRMNKNTNNIYFIVTLLFIVLTEAYNENSDGR